MSNLAILLLAAGASKRMGSPKQLLPWGETHLIEHQINSLRLLQLPLYVVLGANAEEISKVITHKKELCICENKDWSKGMGHSIAFGVSEILSQSPSVEGILIALVNFELPKKGCLNDGRRFEQMVLEISRYRA